MRLVQRYENILTTDLFNLYVVIDTHKYTLTNKYFYWLIQITNVEYFLA